MDKNFDFREVGPNKPSDPSYFLSISKVAYKTKVPAVCYLKPPQILKLVTKRVNRVVNEVEANMIWNKCPTYIVVFVP